MTNSADLPWAFLYVSCRGFCLSFQMLLGILV